MKKPIKPKFPKCRTIEDGFNKSTTIIFIILLLISFMLWIFLLGKSI